MSETPIDLFHNINIYHVCSGPKVPSCAFVQWGNYKSLQNHSFLCFEGVCFNINNFCNHQEVILTHFVQLTLLSLLALILTHTKCNYVTSFVALI